MSAFARPSLLDNRYAVIAETSAYTYDDNDLVNYAEFLRKHGRYMSNKGYVDSTRRIRSLHRQQDDLHISPHHLSPSRGGLLAAINKSSLSSSAPPIPSSTPRKLRSSSDNDLTSISANLENKKREYEKQMRLIEEQMIKAKQSEREAKRLEGDVKKEQRLIRHTLRDLDVDTTKKRYSAHRNLSKNLQEKDHIEQEYVKKREKQTKQRTDRLVDSLQSNKDKDRRNLLLCNDLARQYRNKANELDVKHLQLGRIHSDFEQKVQKRELEENRIKKELKDIALALNLEAQKAKNDMNDFLTMVHQESEKDSKLSSVNLPGKGHDLDRRRLSGDGTIHRSMLDLKQRDALRRIGDTKSRLENVYAKKRQLNSNAAMVSEQDRRATQLKSKMSEIDNRRSQLATQHVRAKADDYQTEATIPVKAPQTDLLIKQHEDQLKHFQKMLDKNEELEHNIRQSVKEAEYQRRKKEQEVQRLKGELIRKKREDAKKIHDAIARAEHEEKLLERHLVKEKTKLDELKTRRENGFSRITRQREYRRENQALLQTHEREHERLMHVQTRSQSWQSLNTI